MTAEENPGRAIVLAAVNAGKPLLQDFLKEISMNALGWENAVDADLAKLDAYAKGCRVRAETLRKGVQYAGFLDVASKMIADETGEPLSSAGEELRKAGNLADAYDKLADDLVRARTALKEMMVEQRDSTQKMVSDLIGFMDVAVKAVGG